MADPAPQMPLPANACRPVGLDLRLGDQVLAITWADGHQSEYRLGLLRRECPCAACRTEREKPAPMLPILSSRQSGEVRATGGHLVGNYALQIDWTDGHNAGIYDFQLLRALDGKGR